MLLHILQKNKHLDSRIRVARAFNRSAPSSAVVVDTVVGVRRERSRLGRSVGFVPTMGALHKGHLSLINKSKSAETFTVCSIFVNPTQFNNPEDFQKYPITIEEDIKLLKMNGCDILFLPSHIEIYPHDFLAKNYEL